MVTVNFLLEVEYPFNIKSVGQLILLGNHENMRL